MTTFVEGNPNNRKYLDATGKPLLPGDTILYCVSRSSSVSLNFAIVDEIVDLPKPVYLGQRNGDRLETWDRAFKLKVRTLEKKDPINNVWGPPRYWEWDPVASDGEHVEQKLDEIKLTTIHAVQRVVKVEIALER